MTGVGSLESYFCCLCVANLAHHDHIGVLAKDGAQSGGKGYSCPLVNLDLIDAWQLILHWVFYSDDVYHF